MDEKTLEESRLIAVAALMHDIGKFMQRASAKTKQSFDHSELSDAFFGEQSEVKYNEPYGFIDNLRFLVGHHHEKAIDESDKRGKLRVLAEILSEADNISSGEREIDTRKTIGLLIPILSQVSLEEKEPVSSQNFFLRLNPLSFSSPSDLLYPDVLSGISEENIESSYMKHWKDFFQEYRELVMANDKKLLPDSLFYLLEKYCWCIPSAYYQTQPDISLFEHSKITAALATCMHRFLSDSGNSIFNLDDPKKIREYVKDRSEKRFLFVLIDVNGIQDFIYSISHRKGLKSLKGRSFYIELLSEVILRHIIWDPEINLFESNIVFSGGGKGYLLLPINYRRRLEELKEEIEKWLLEKFEGRLMASFGILEASADDFSKQNIGKSWQRVLELASEDKQHKFRSIIRQNYEKFFEPKQEGGYFGADGMGEERVICGICRSETSKSKAEPEDNGEYYICEECRRFVKIGRKLKDSKYVVFSESEFENYLDSIGEERKTYFGLAEKTFITKNRTLVLNFSDEHIPQNGFSKNVSFGFYLYGGRSAPEAETLEDLIDRSVGIERLGILKMDVDNLGLVMSRGLRERTLSRISQLSSSISLFFRGEINNIIAKSQYFNFKDSIYVIYAGGDDLFAVGSWEAIPEFASEVRRRFARYACNNSSLTISAGIHLIKKSYPLYRGALYTTQAEDSAKAYENKGKKKDAVDFLGITVSWNDLEVSRIMKNAVVETCKRTGKKSVLRQLQAIDGIYKKQKRLVAGKKSLSQDELVERAKWSRWIWLIAYMIGRSTEEDVKQSLECIRTALISDEIHIKEKIVRSDKPVIEFLELPITWADYQIRNKEERNAR